jgi:hypothetical protein
MDDMALGAASLAQRMNIQRVEKANHHEKDWNCYRHNNPSGRRAQ